MQKNRQAYQKCKRFLQQRKQVQSISQVRPIVYNNDEYLLALNDKKKVEFKKPEFPISSKINTQKPLRPRSLSPDQNSKRISPSANEITELLRLIDSEAENQHQNNESSVSWTGPLLTASNNSLKNDKASEKTNNEIRFKPSSLSIDQGRRGQAQKNILKCNYRTGDNQLWSNDPAVPDSSIYYILRSKFGLKEFRNNQKAIIKCSLLGNDVFVCMPTGGGKSLSFQLPLAYELGLTICIMPLVSLIYDQECLAKKLKLIVYSATGSTALEELRQFYSELKNLEDLEQGIMLLTTPEKMTASPRLIGEIESVYNKGLLRRIVIDEAHCVSTWGRDFREDYANLGFVKKKFPKTPVLALTATATEQVKIDVISKLGISQCYFFQSSFNRPNLFYSVREKGKRLKDQILEICRKYSGKSGIVYCLSKKDCEKVAEMLNKEKISAAYYYADLKPDRKKQIQELWMTNQIQIIVATIAFGMGINKPDVRFVIHQTISKSLENYYQESGRAGRDGEFAQCILFYRRSDKLQFMNFNLNNQFSTTESKDFNQKSLLAIVRYGQERFECRRVFQLSYLGEEFTKEQCGKTCDNCQADRHYRQMQCMEGVHEMVRFLNEAAEVRQTLTMTQLGLILAGTNNKQLAQKIQFLGRKGVELDRYVYFSTWKTLQIETLVMSLINEGVLREETYVSNKFTHSQIKVDQFAWRKFMQRSSYSIKIQTSNKLTNKTNIIEEEPEEEEKGEESEGFQQFAKPKKRKSKNDTSSDEQLFHLLESQRSNRLLFKYISEGDSKSHSPEAPNQEDMSDLLSFLEDIQN